MLSSLILAVALLGQVSETKVQIWIGQNCPACEAYKSTIVQLQQEGWSVSVSSVDDYPEIARKCKIITIPATVIYKDSKILLRCTGNASVDWVRFAMRSLGVRGPRQK